MSNKIIQLSTKQCPPCQVLKKEIEKVIGSTKYEYEYISLYNGVDMDNPKFNIEDYWVEVRENIDKYRNLYNLNFQSFPTVIKQEDDDLTLIPSKQIIDYLKNSNDNSGI